MCYIDIQYTKLSIDREFKRYYDPRLDYTYDYIFVCYFLGNDFLPHLPSIDIKVQGMEHLFDAYAVCVELFQTNLLTMVDGRVHICNLFLREFLKQIASKEADYFGRIHPEHMRRSRRRRCDETEPHKIELWEIENMRNINQVDPVRLDRWDADPDDAKYRYYHHYFKTDEHIDQTIDKVCHNYLEGLVWVARYYFEQCPSWRWQYNHTNAPFLSDLARYMESRDIMVDFPIVYREPVDIYTQLVGCVPCTHTHVLPVHLHGLHTRLDSPVLDMFPRSYQLDMIGKTQLYKCIPMIPWLDIERIEQAVMRASTVGSTVGSTPSSTLDSTHAHKPTL
jgi:5'-3' exonuclease